MIFNDIDIYRKALKECHLERSVMPTSRGFLIEDVDSYNKIQQLLHIPQFEKCHTYLLNLNVEDLNESEVKKINQLYETAKEYGLISPEQDITNDFEDDDPQNVTEDNNVYMDQAVATAPGNPIPPVAQPVAPTEPAFICRYTAVQDGKMRTGEFYSNASSANDAREDAYGALTMIGLGNVKIIAVEGDNQPVAVSTTNDEESEFDSLDDDDEIQISTGLDGDIEDIVGDEATYGDEDEDFYSELGFDVDTTGYEDDVEGTDADFEETPDETAPEDDVEDTDITADDFEDVDLKPEEVSDSDLDDDLDELDNVDDTETDSAPEEPAEDDEEVEISDDEDETTEEPEEVKGDDEEISIEDDEDESAEQEKTEESEPVVEDEPEDTATEQPAETSAQPEATTEQPTETPETTEPKTEAPAEPEGDNGEMSVADTPVDDTSDETSVEQSATEEQPVQDDMQDTEDKSEDAEKEAQAEKSEKKAEKAVKDPGETLQNVNDYSKVFKTAMAKHPGQTITDLTPEEASNVYAEIANNFHGEYDDAVKNEFATKLITYSADVPSGEEISTSEKPKPETKSVEVQ
jgi:pilus assembly protein FimV